MQTLIINSNEPFGSWTMQQINAHQSIYIDPKGNSDTIISIANKYGQKQIALANGDIIVPPKGSMIQWYADD